MAKAVNAGQSELTTVVKDALMRRHGSLKAAAITYEMDPGQLTRELQTGDFKLKKLANDPAALVCLAEGIHHAYGQLNDPKTRARRVCDQMDVLVNEIRQFVDVS